MILLIIFVLCLTSCKRESSINGNYSTCFNGLYAELYMKNDSMRVATSMDWISNSRKYIIKKDSIFHLLLGNSRDSIKGKINFIDNDEFEIHYSNDSIIYSFYRIKERIINWEKDYAEFWNTFIDRKISFGCFY